MKQYLLGCDWGTSSFRIRLIKAENQEIIYENTSKEGVASTFSDWQKRGMPLGITREQFFRMHLQKNIQLIAEKIGRSLDKTPLVISGMASSSIGLEELPYATLPFPTDGSQTCLKQFNAQPDFPHDVLLISGVCSQYDVMRGEETQLIGLMALLDAQHYAIQNTIIIFPGTHSKHIYIKNHQLIDFQTFMTGEVFNLMSQQSILKDSVEVIYEKPFSTSDLDAFKTGVHEENATSILNNLFKVRINQLFNRFTKQQNALFLSGLLIGNELKSLTKQKDWGLILCSNTNLYELYKIAMQELDLTDRTITISADMLDKATIAGQIKIMKNQLISSSK